MKNIKRLVVMMMAILMFAGSFSVLAEVPYHSYNYSFEGEKSDSPAGYLPDKVITGYDLGIGHFSNPNDIFVDKNNDIYLVDTDNKRIVVMDSNFNLKKVIDTFTYEGQPYDVNTPMGVFVTEEGEIYIASHDRIDPETGALHAEGGEVIVCDGDGVINRFYRKPVTPYLDGNRQFQPKKVVVDSQNVIYALSDNINEGIVSVDQDNKFLGFFGSEKVSMTAAELADYYWRKLFLNEVQIAQLVSFQPTEYSNLYIDDDDFIYTSSAYEWLQAAHIKRLNPNGANILDSTQRFGDLRENTDEEGKIVKHAFIDVTADDDGFFFCLDKNVCRIYVYSQDSELLMIFGEKGTEIGTFAEPVAIEKVNGNILVLDKKKENLTIFESTTYGNALRDGVKRYQKGLYSEALEPWETVRDMNANFEDAYTGIGKAQMLLASTLEEGEESKALYQSSMDNFHLANDRENYSESKKEMRTISLRENFSLIFIGIIVLFVLLKVYSKFKVTINASIVKLFKNIISKIKKEGK